MGNCQRFGMHFSQIVEDCVSDCQRLSSARTRTRNSFSSFNPPQGSQDPQFGSLFHQQDGPSLTEFHSIDNETLNITETVLKLLTVMINMKRRQFLLTVKRFTEDNTITKCQPLIYPMSY